MRILRIWIIPIVRVSKINQTDDKLYEIGNNLVMNIKIDAFFVVLQRSSRPKLETSQTNLLEWLEAVAQFNNRGSRMYVPLLVHGRISHQVSTRGSRNGNGNVET